MKCIIPEISWHNRDPVLCVDIQNKKESENFYRLASGGIDAHVLIWQVLRQDDGTLKLDCVCDLTRHQKSVNVVKFSPSGEYLASGDDESYIIIWRQKTEHDTNDLLVEEEKDVPVTGEQWIQIKVLRGHLNDIYDLCWSPDSVHLISGSVDNSAIIWDVVKGKKVALFSEAKNFVQGVAWDPENVYVSTLSSDGKCRTYNWRTHKMVAAVGKGKIQRQNQTESLIAFQKNSDTSSEAGNLEAEKPVRLFHDDTLKTFFRRLAFSPDGSLLAAPSGCLLASPDAGTTKSATWLFLRRNLSSPVLHYPSLNQPTTVTRWCPLLFTLREEVNSPVFSLPYRMVLAVATKTSILLYDTQHAVPIAMISNIHYTKLTDLTWSPDGNMLIASSTDGYCSIVTFADGELGTIYTPTKLAEAQKIVS